MTALQHEPKIIGMANALNVAGKDPVSGILTHCKGRVRRVQRALKRGSSIQELESALCRDLNLTIREVWTDADISALIEEYARAKGEIQFAALHMDLEGDCYGVLVQCSKTIACGNFQYVAVIDCRGAKANRRFFTRWHEIAHCLTAYQQFEFPFRRTSETTIRKDPIETLMDMIAGEIGFFDPIFQPILDKELNGRKELSFDVVEGVRAQFSTDASLQATLNACSARLGSPMIVVEAAPKFKKDEERVFRSSERALFPDLDPQPRLRVISAIPNSPARDLGLFIFRNIRVPESSSIYQAFRSGTNTAAFEDLADWSASDGTHLRAARVKVEARSHAGGVLAIVSPIARGVGNSVEV